MTQIRITASDVSLTATLNDSSTARLIADALPIVGRVQTWGDEIYFPIPISAGNDKTAAEVVEKGPTGLQGTRCAFSGVRHPPVKAMRSAPPAPSTYVG